MHFLESEPLLLSLLNKFPVKGDNVKTLIGDEIGVGCLSRCSIIYSPFNYYRGEKGFVSVIGPYGMNYRKIIPTVRKVAKFIDESIRGWE